MKKFLIFSGSRSEYGLLKSLLKKLNKLKDIDPYLIVSGSHLLKNYGNTIQEINNDKIKISKIIKYKYKNMNSKNLSNNASNLIADLSKYFIEKKPEALILLGDRFETFVAAVAGVISKTKIIHIHGGELTFGSRDDLYRHAISKMSNYHFVSTKYYEKRLKQMGENKKNIFRVGALCNDNIKNLKMLSDSSLENKIKTKLYDKNILVSIHPNTKSKKKNISEINVIFKSLLKFKNYKFFFSAPNSDENSEDIISRIKSFCKQNKNTYYKASFGHEIFLNLLKKCDLIIGNSSSGIIEAPLLGTPSINIGDRQKGRVRADHTYDCNVNCKKIISLIERILSKKKKKLNLQTNPYYGKNVSNKIYKIIKKINFNDLNHKYFKDIKFQ